MIEKFFVGDYIYLTAMQTVVFIEREETAEYASQEFMQTGARGDKIIRLATPEEIVEYKRRKR